MTESTALDPVLERVLTGTSLSPEDWDTLTATPDILSLGMAADDLRRRRHGDRVTFVRVVDLDLTETDGTSTPAATAGEVRLHGSVGDAECVERVREVVSRAGGRVPVTGFSLAAIEQRADGDLEAARVLLASLADAGLEAIAEAPLDELSAAEDMVGLAGDVGLWVARVTVKRPFSDHAELLRRAAALFRAHPALCAFAPLPQAVPGGAPTTGYEDVRTVALARLLVPANHVQVSWADHGPKLAQVALTFGADDVDAVSPLDQLGEGRRRAPLAEIRRNIEAAGGRAVERNGRFDLLD